MKSKVSEWILDSMSDEIKIFTDKYADLLFLIHLVMQQKGYTQKALANSLGKQPSEINKWLSGEHNLTLRTIAKLEAELGVTLLEVPLPKRFPSFKPAQTTIYTVVVNTASGKRVNLGNNWRKIVSEPTTYASSNVG